MSQALTVSAVSEHTREWGSPPSGPFTEYKVKFQEKGEDVFVWSKKATSLPPTAGLSVLGDFESTPYGTKFKQEFQQQQQGGRLGGSNKADFRTKEQIIVQESLSAASMLAVARAAAGQGFDYEWVELTANSIASRVRDAKEYGGEPAGDGFKPKDIQPTGQSDVPNDGFEQQKLEPKPDDDIPF